VYVDALGDTDLETIVSTLHPTISAPLRKRMIEFNARLLHETMTVGRFGRRGAPWDFNLRDVFRWCEAMERWQAPDRWDPGALLDIVYVQVRSVFFIFCMSESRLFY
jgi:midasin